MVSRVGNGKGSSRSNNGRSNDSRTQTWSVDAGAHHSDPSNESSQANAGTVSAPDESGFGFGIDGALQGEAAGPSSNQYLEIADLQDNTAAPGTDEHGGAFGFESATPTATASDFDEFEALL